MKFRYSIIVIALISVSSLSGHSQGKIAFDSCGDGNCEIYLVNPDGTGEVRLTFNPAMDNDPALSWSSTNNKIAFITNRDGNPELYIMNMDGSNPTRLTTTTKLELDPSFSPDGSKIVYVEGQAAAGFSSRICLMNSDGSNYRCLSTPGTRNESPSFSPNGRKIVFNSNRDLDSTYGSLHNES
jgi:TolB protein